MPYRRHPRGRRFARTRLGAAIALAVTCASVFACASAQGPGDATAPDPESTALCMRACDRSNQCQRERYPYECISMGDCDHTCKDGDDHPYFRLLRARRRDVDTCIAQPCPIFEACLADILGLPRPTPPPPSGVSEDTVNELPMDEEAAP